MFGCRRQRQSTSVAAAWDCLRRGDVNGAVGASAASRASSSGTSATGRVTDVAASRRRRCSASQCRRRRAKTQSSHKAFARNRRNAAVTIFDDRKAAIYEETVSILEGVRLAGSYKQYVLRDFKGLLRTRSLLARGHALLGPQTPEVVARLFGGRADPTASRRATRRRKPPPQRPAGVPDPAFWLVMEYWRLGDWRRPSE